MVKELQICLHRARHRVRSQNRRASWMATVVAWTARLSGGLRHRKRLPVFTGGKVETMVLRACL